MNPQLPLRDIHLPAPVGWWPPAPGWWLVALGMPLVLALLYWLYKRLTRQTAVQAGKRALTALKQDGALDDRQKLAELSVLFRRTAVSLFPRVDTASLTGDAWLAFLQQPLKDKRFTEGAGRLLSEAPYRREAPNADTLRALFELYEDWLKAVAKRKKR
ncbi:MAG: DUF4381 domain-containing protein [Gammaproteobacteria bacterium]